jgi:hypothetical protein
MIPNGPLSSRFAETDHSPESSEMMQAITQDVRRVLKNHREPDPI